MSGKELQTVVSISGVMSPSLRKAVADVNRQLETIDKQALKTAASIGEGISNAAKTAAKAVGGLAVAGAGLAAGAFIKGGTDYIRTMNGIAVQTGATGKELQSFKDIAAEIYEGGRGESLQAVADALVNIEQASGLAGEELKAAANASLLLSDSFGMEASESTRAATALMKNFGISAEEAYGLIAYGAQNGANKNGDLLDTLNEYSVHYKALGLDANAFVDSLVKGAEAGAFSVDKVGDAIKEFTIRSKDGSKTSAEGFEALGLNAETMTAQFAAGGRSAQAAFQQVVKALDSMEDPVAKNAAGVALFGTMYEDLEAGAISAFAKMSSGAIDAEKTLRDIEAVKYNDLGYAITQVGRTFETALMPSAEKAGQAIFAQMPQIKESIAGVMPTVAALGESFAAALPGIIDTLGQVASAAAEFGGVVVDNWGIIQPILVTAGGIFAGMKLVQFAQQAYAVGTALTQVTLAYGRLYLAKAKDMVVTGQVMALYARDAAAKGLAAARSYAAAAATAAQTAATTVWSGVCVAATTVTTALGAALAFLTSPIGLAIAAVAALVAAGVLLYKNWDLVKAKAAELGAYLAAAWANITATVSALAGQLGDFVGNVWTKIKDGATSLGSSIVGTLTGAFQAIPGILKAPINGAISLINGAIGAINGIGFTIPDWVPGIGGKAFSVDIPQIPMLAKGGFTKGVSIAGEAGTEAVISFDPAYRKQNIGYLAKAAQMLGLRTSDEDSLGYYAQRLESLGGGENLATSTSNNTTYNLGGVTFAPTVTVAGANEKKENIIEQLRSYEGDLLDLIEDLLSRKEAASYGASF